MQTIYNVSPIYNKLHKDLLHKKGNITFNLNGISREIEGTDIIGNCIQEWLKEWFDIENICYKTLENTQEFPDYLIKVDGQYCFLEIKSWNWNATPAFDLANFNSYLKTVKENPLKLDTDYLIFAYSINNAEITIENIYLKKIWEITGKGNQKANAKKNIVARERPLSVQVKDNVLYNIRPVSFHKYPNKPFLNRRSFLEALILTKKEFADQGAKIDLNIWKNEILRDYKASTGNEL